MFFCIDKYKSERRTTVGECVRRNISNEDLIIICPLRVTMIKISCCASLDARFNVSQTVFSTYYTTFDIRSLFYYILLCYIIKSIIKEIIAKEKI